MSESATRFDRTAYFSRIAFEGEPAPTLAVLEALHRKHVERIPFENVDVRLGRPIRLALDALQEKVVQGGRGGYCFEQNTLFAAALRSIGFDVQTLEARVRPPDATAVLPRTHMLLRVITEGHPFLADVGFGGDGPFGPVPFDGSVSVQPGGSYRIERESEHGYVLRWAWRGSWRSLYAFRLEPALPIDFEVANHFTSTWPRSPFVQTLTVQRSSPEARHILRGRTYTARRADGETQREVERRDLPALVRGTFGLSLPDDELLAALGDA